MKTISSHQLTKNPSEIWNNFVAEGLFVITQDDQPMTILLPTSKEKVEEDVRKEVGRRTCQSVTEMLHGTAFQGFDKMTLDKINVEITATRREMRSKK